MNKVKPKVAQTCKNGVWHFLQEDKSHVGEKVMRKACEPTSHFYNNYKLKELKATSSEIVRGEVTCKKCLAAMGLVEVSRSKNLYVVQHKSGLFLRKRKDIYSCNTLVPNIVEASFYKVTSDEHLKTKVFRDENGKVMSEAEYLKGTWQERMLRRSSWEVDKDLKFVKLNITLDESEQQTERT